MKFKSAHYGNPLLDAFFSIMIFVFFAPATASLLLSIVLSIERHEGLGELLAIMFLLFIGGILIGWKGCTIIGILFGFSYPLLRDYVVREHLIKPRYVPLIGGALAIACAVITAWLMKEVSATSGVKMPDFTMPKAIDPLAAWFVLCTIPAAVSGIVAARYLFPLDEYSDSDIHPQFPRP